MNTGRYDGEGGFILRHVPRPNEQVKIEDAEPDLCGNIVVLCPFHNENGNFIYFYFEDGVLDEKTGKPIIATAPVRCENNTHCDAA